MRYLKFALVIFLLATTTAFSGVKESILAGNKAMDNGNFDKAIGHYSEAIKLAKSNYNGWYGRANAYLYKGEFDKAISDFNKVIELNPNFPDAYNNRGLAKSYTADFEGALKDLDKAISLDKNFSQAYYNRANTYGAKNELDKAEKDYIKAISLDKNNPMIYFELGTIYYKQGNFEQAAVNFDQAIKAGYPDPEIHYTKGNAHFRLEEYQKAIDEYTEVLKTNPGHTQAINNRSVAYDKTGQAAKAQEDRKMLEEIQGFVLPPVEQLAFKPYYVSNSGIEISLPESWNVVQYYENGKATMMVSPQQLENNAPFSIGVTINHEKDMNEKFGVVNPKELLEFWESSAIKNNQGMHQYNILSKKLKYYENYEGFINKTVLQVSKNSPEYVFYEFVYARFDEIIYIYFQSPVANFPYMEKIFDKALESIKLP